MGGLFLQKNIVEAFQATKKPPIPVTKMMRISTPAGKGVHNYSIQTLNSAVLAKKELYQEMAKVCDSPQCDDGRWLIQ